MDLNDGKDGGLEGFLICLNKDVVMQGFVLQKYLGFMDVENNKDGD